MRNRSDFLHVAAASALAVLGFLAPSGGEATTITQQVSLINPNYDVTGNGSTSFLQFDPSLGTLNAVTFQYTGNGGGTPYVSFINSSSSSDYMDYWLQDPTGQTTLASQSWNTSAYTGYGLPLSFTYSDPLLAQYIGVGSTYLQFSVSKHNSSDWVTLQTDCYTCSDRTAIALITYDYTASATPLPATLPLFASGLGALGLLGWRRKKKAAALAA